MTATMVGASSSTSATQQGKRKTGATWAQHTKRQRHHSLAIPAALGPLQMAVPITGINAAAPCWSTAAALAGAASRTAAQALPLAPPVVPDAPQAPGAKLVAPAAGEQQMAPVPVRFCGYVAMPVGAAGAPPLALAAALDLFHSATLGRMLSALTPSCLPPLRPQEARSGAAPPAWWPTASEGWWAPEVVAHLPGLMAPVPFVATKVLKKAQKVAVLVAVVKHLAPDFARVDAAVRRCGLSAPEAALWSSAIENVQGWRVRPVFVAQHAGGGKNHLLPSYGQEVAEAEPQEQHAVVAPADGFQQVAGGDGVHFGAEIHKMADVETEKPQPEQDVFAAPGLGTNKQLEDVLAPFPAAHADDLHHLVRHHCGKLSGAAVAAQQEELDDRPWYQKEELLHKFSHMPIGSPHSYDGGYYL